MNIKFLCIIVAIICISKPGISQTRSVGISLGLSSSTISIKSYSHEFIDFSIEVSNVIQPVLGIRLEYVGKKGFTHGFEFNYLSRSFKSITNLYDDQGVLIQTGPNDHHLNSIEAPFFFGKQFGKKIIYGINLVLIPNYIFSPERNEQDGSVNQISDLINSFNIDAGATGYVGYKFGKVYQLNGEFRYQQALMDLYKEGTSAYPYYGHSEIMSFVLCFSYNF